MGPFVDQRLQAEVRQKLGFPAQSSMPSYGNRPGFSGTGSQQGPENGGRMVMGSLAKSFEVLGISANAKPEEIKKAYKLLALKHHPDKHPEDPEKAKKTFQAINNAFQQIKEALNL